MDRQKDTERWIEVTLNAFSPTLHVSPRLYTLRKLRTTLFLVVSLSRSLFNIMHIKRIVQKGKKRERKRERNKKKLETERERERDMVARSIPYYSLSLSE